MNTQNALLFFVFQAGLGLVGFGQTPPVNPPIALNELTYIDSSDMVANGMTLPQMGSGSFYIQLIIGGHIGNSIRRISFDGKAIKTYDVDKILKPKSLADRTLFVESFIVGPGKSVLVLTSWLKDRVTDITNILVFDGDGGLKNIIPIGLENAQVQHFARFNDGKFLLLAATEGSAGFGSVDMVILESSGSIASRKSLRRLSEAELQQATDGIAQDIKENQKQQKTVASNSNPASPQTNTNSDASRGKASMDESPRPDHEMETLFSRTVMISGEDGNIYLIRPDHPDSLYRVSSSGEMTEVPFFNEKSSGAGDSRKDLLSGAIEGSRLLLFYVETQPSADFAAARKMRSVEIEIFDLVNRERVNAYVGDDRLSNLFVGWEDRSFYFLKYVKNAQPPGFEIVRATP